MNIASTGKTISLLRNMLDTTKQTLSPIEFTERKPILKSNSETFFERVTPEKCGIDSKHVKDYIEKLASEKRVGLQSIMIMRGNKVFFEATVGSHDAGLPKATFSECKSVVSLAIGVLVSKGMLKLSERVVDILPEKALPVAKIKLKSLTVKHLLNMTSAVTFNESEAMVSSDWVKGYLNSDTEGTNGRKFRYNSLNSYMLSAIIKERSGMTLSEFLDMTVFGALNITDYYWEKCPMGLEMGGWGLYIRREDMAKLGLLVMQNGVWNGKRIISERYIAEATKAKATVPIEYGDYNYGYHIWCGRTVNSFLFNGVFGQNLLGYRESGVMIIANCGNGDTFQQGAFFNITHKFFNRSFCEVLPDNGDAFDELNNLKEALANGRFIKPRSFLESKQAPRDLMADMDAINGKFFEFKGPNAASAGFAPLLLQLIHANYTHGTNCIRFRKVDGRLVMDFFEEDECHTFPIGFGETEQCVIFLHDEPFTIAASGNFAENEDGIPVLKIECAFLETPFTRVFKFFFDAQYPYAIFTEVPGNDISRIANVVASTVMPNVEKMESVFTKIDGDYITNKLEKAFAIRLSMTETQN